MIPDSYRIRSPDAFEVHGEGESPIAANRIDIKVDANALAIVALILSVGAMVALYMSSQASDRLAAKEQQVVDSKILAGIAKTEAIANAAQVNARVALDKVQNVKVELAKRGISIKDD
jgi:hypothetical protein